MIYNNMIFDGIRLAAGNGTGNLRFQSYDHYHFALIRFINLQIRLFWAK